MRYFVLLFVIAGFTPSYAQFDYYIDKFQFGVLTEVNSSSSFYDRDGETQSENYRDVLGKPTKYFYEYRELAFGIYGKYKPIEKLFIYGEIPISFHSMSESQTRRYENTDPNLPADSISVKMRFDSLSMTRIDHFIAGARYYLLKDEFFLGLAAEARIPSTFNDGVRENPGTDFLSDGAIELLTGITTGFNLETILLEASLMHNQRSEDLENEIQYHFLLGFTKVKNTMIKFDVNYIQSLAEWDNVEPFSPFKTPRQSDYFKAGFGFHAYFEPYYGFFEYYVGLGGRNQMNMGEFRAGLGVNL
ncbi:MAG: hypothetical protein ACLFR2_06965 [Candidatus Kapaibacterium sp.]